jgi:FkbM family methyltransferase
MTVWDVGANVGLYTLPAARRVRPKGWVYAFEPMPCNLRFLRRHLALNRVVNVTVCEAAAWDMSGTVRMVGGDSPSEWRVHPQGEWEVRAIALDDWRVQSGSPPPDVIKIDVEGSEDAVLRGATETLVRYRPVIYLALHGERQGRECRRRLEQWGYRVASLEGLSLDASSEWRAEPA